MKSILIASMLLLFSVTGFADQWEDQPKPDESFPAFFQRITRGGRYQGIRLKAPERVQQSFLHRIKRGTWVGEVNRQRRFLQDRGVDLWFDWYKQEVPAKLLFASADQIKEFSRYLGDENKALLSKPWQELTAPEMQAYTQALVEKAPIYNGRMLIDYLADFYADQAKEALAQTGLFILPNSQFKEKVKELGWNGPVYFRALTGEVPGKPGRFWIVMDYDNMKARSEYTRPIYRFLEFAAIYVHELGHIFQERMAQRLQVELIPQSFEALMLLEGLCEFSAEQALIDSSRDYMNEVNPLGLFAAERGYEVVNRPGNEQSGQLFPYTVGMPFSASLFDLVRPEQRHSLTEDIIKIIGNQVILEPYLFEKF